MLLLASAAAATTVPGPGASRALNQGIAQGHALRRERARSDLGVIAIVIDDLGQQQQAGLRALALPGPVALAFMPHAPNTASQAEAAWRRGKEVLVHLPLEPGGDARPYPTSLSAATNRSELGSYFLAALASVPHARGVNNHQGSLFTERLEPMSWLIGEIRKQAGLYFLDSRTSPESVGYRLARAHGVPAAERSVFLDNERGEAAVRAAFGELIKKARRNGRALAIGHPYPETFAVLEAELPQLARHGLQLVAPSQLIALQSGGRSSRRLKLSTTLTLAAAPCARAGGLRSCPTTPAAAPCASAGGLRSCPTTPATTPTTPARQATTSASAR